MKKLLAIAFLFALVLGFASCKKDHTCTCSALGISADTTLKDMTKKDAKETCEGMSASAFGIDVTCKLK
ncbi:MAG: hypothetical protein MRY83_23880 [Flavobacteriales bacterium]|nr:hypothetical protein [Flavobacteriales bacterium]